MTMLAIVRILELCPRGLLVSPVKSIFLIMKLRLLVFKDDNNDSDGSRYYDEDC